MAMFHLLKIRRSIDILKKKSVKLLLALSIVCYMYTAIVHHRQTGSGNAEVVLIYN